MKERIVELELEEELTTKQIIINLLKEKKEPVPSTIIYKELAHIQLSQRTVRQHLLDLSEAGHIRKIKCPCGMNSLYFV